MTMVVGSLAARDYKGVGSQYVDEGKVVVEAFTKGKRPQTSTDDETRDENRPAPTINAFDQGDTRATTIIVGSLQARDHKGANHEGARDGKLVTEPVLLTMREGKPGGGKGPLLSTDKSLSLSTSNEQLLFTEAAIPIHDQATRFAGKRGDKQDGKGNGLGIGNPGDPMNTLTSADRHAVATTMAVRRLTPLECERLMGWPDDWTAGQSDTHRYKQCGNGVASPVAQWIGEILIATDASTTDTDCA
jgi:site-specific DNA-cytosine methylase